jgi:hypothetical protein
MNSHYLRYSIANKVPKPWGLKKSQDLTKQLQDQAQTINSFPSLLNRRIVMVAQSTTDHLDWYSSWEHWVDCFRVSPQKKKSPYVRIWNQRQSVGILYSSSSNPLMEWPSLSISFKLHTHHDHANQIPPPIKSINLIGPSRDPPLFIDTRLSLPNQKDFTINPRKDP